MANYFDICDTENWYFGAISRHDSEELLAQERGNGIFLIRNSITIKNNYVLCVRENDAICHYIINKVQDSKLIDEYQLGHRRFMSLTELVLNYKTEKLKTTRLKRPAKRILRRVRALYDFNSVDPEDLSFKRYDILHILSEDEDCWWTARNSCGEIDKIPYNRVETVAEDILIHSKGSGLCGLNNYLIKKLPTLARVTKALQPNTYDKTALRLNVGDLILVTRIGINGLWVGELNGKVGRFHVTYVEFMEDIKQEHDNDDSEAAASSPLIRF